VNDVACGPLKWLNEAIWGSPISTAFVSLVVNPALLCSTCMQLCWRYWLVFYVQKFAQLLSEIRVFVRQRIAY